MKWILLPQKIKSHHRRRIGGKAYALSQLTQAGFQIPQTLFVTADAYRSFVAQSGLSERILLELNRKEFHEMRWEEIWDCATRIRNFFLRQTISGSLYQQLKESIEVHFKGKPVAVRSSALDEDSKGNSFAGLHASFLNVNGIESILDHILRVWASLWSDAALLYRQEIGLSVEKSAMAVVIQETIASQRSGVVFSQSPTAENHCIIESVHGLNQGLVDGVVAPDRWIIDRESGKIIEHIPPRREDWIIMQKNGVAQTSLPAHLQETKPLNDQEVSLIYQLSQNSERFFGVPQDVEWTFSPQELFVLQSRPITTLSPHQSQDKRAWYLSLHRSFENLKSMRSKIEDELIPEMILVAGKLTQTDLSLLSNHELTTEIQSRWDISQKWTTVYWDEFIPYAHGVRLFGQIYNDAVRPDDPYEFLNLLTGSDMASLERNHLLMEMADMVRGDPDLLGEIRTNNPKIANAAFQKKLEHFVQHYGDLSCAATGGRQCTPEIGLLYNMIREIAENPAPSTTPKSKQLVAALTRKFLDCFEEDKQDEALELLDLARSSYRLRDDDNIHLGRIEAHYLAAVNEAAFRIQTKGTVGDRHLTALEDLLHKLDVKPTGPTQHPEIKKGKSPFQPRQLVGQPAGPGLSKGKARVIHNHVDLVAFKHGEILVCDAVDPNMTFVIPLASGVVERRGGMLIHGAIIAREYGLPCVTGIPDATILIETGDSITVDGYLGIVTISKS